MISVIVPVRGGAELLSRQLERLLDQDRSAAYEVLVSNNSADEAISAVCRRWATTFPDLQVIDSSDRPGASGARNRAAEVARGDRLLFCDADDEVGEEWLRRLADGLENADIVAGSIDLVGGADEASWRGGLGIHGFLPYGLGANLAVRAALFRDLGGFDESLLLGEDLDLCWRAQLRGARFTFVPEANVRKRRREGLAAAWRQHFDFGLIDAELYRRFRAHGMPRRVRQALRAYAWLAVRAPLLWRPVVRERWTRVAARRSGRLRGSLRCKVAYP